jgi:hypothetical protein
VSLSGIFGVSQYLIIIKPTILLHFIWYQSDFDFACIPNIVDNSKVESDWTNKINISPKQNRYYDVHYFFNTFTRKGFFNEFWTEKEIPDKAKEFVRRVVPDKYASGKNVSEKGRILVNDEFLTADEILKNDIFFILIKYNNIRL